MKTDIGLLILRLASGLTMLFAHGWPKLINFTAKSGSFPSLLGLDGSITLSLAVFAEVFCAIMVAAGFLTRFAAIPLIATMFVAVFIIHSGDPFQKQELGLMYLACYTALFFTGGGNLGFDRFLKIGK